MAKIKNTEIYKKEVYDLVGNEYIVLDEYIKGTLPIRMKHNKCGNILEIAPKYFLSGNTRCKYCSGKFKKDNKYFLKQVYDLVQDEYTFLEEYVNTHKNLKVRHNICKHEYSVKPTNFLQGKRCPNCSGLSKKSTKSFSNEVLKLGKSEYILKSEYINNKTNIDIYHIVCGNTYSVSPSNFISGYRCPHCSYSNGKSLLETEFLNFIKSIYSKRIIENNRTILNDLELDIYLPDVKIAIEFNGLYWHSEEASNGRCNKKYHLNKTNRCKEKGIRLIHIFEDEWVYKKDIVKSKIKYILKESNDLPKIFARKCYIKEISDVSLKNHFLMKNHIQGKDNSLLTLGLYYNNDLVSIMTFGELRKSLGRNSEKNIYELVRFCNDNRFIVIGSFSKLWTYFKNNYEFNEVITYADLRYSIGNVYLKNNFEFIRYSDPSYHYVKNDIKYHRYTFRKQNLKKLFPDIYSDNETERHIMNKAGYKTIWDCGNMVFSYKNE